MKKLGEFNLTRDQIRDIAPAFRRYYSALNKGSKGMVIAHIEIGLKFDGVATARVGYMTYDESEKVLDIVGT